MGPLFPGQPLGQLKRTIKRPHERLGETGRDRLARLLLRSARTDSTAFPPNTIFIFTANGTDNLEPRSLSRCRVIEFGTYGLAGPAADLLRTIWKAEIGDSESAPDFARIVKQSANNVREALMNLELRIMEA